MNSWWSSESTLRRPSPNGRTGEVARTLAVTAGPLKSVAFGRPGTGGILAFRPNSGNPLARANLTRSSRARIVWGQEKAPIQNGHGAWQSQLQQAPCHCRRSWAKRLKSKQSSTRCTQRAASTDCMLSSRLRPGPGSQTTMVSWHTYGGMARFHVFPFPALFVSFTRIFSPKVVQSHQCRGHHLTAYALPPGCQVNTHRVGSLVCQMQVVFAFA
jgi:hypothetical protein